METRKFIAFAGLAFALIGCGVDSGTDFMPKYESSFETPILKDATKFTYYPSHITTKEGKLAENGLKVSVGPDLTQPLSRGDVVAIDALHPETLNAVFKVQPLLSAYQQAEQLEAYLELLNKFLGERTGGDFGYEVASAKRDLAKRYHDKIVELHAKATERKSFQETLGRVLAAQKALEAKGIVLKQEARFYYQTTRSLFGGEKREVMVDSNATLDDKAGSMEATRENMPAAIQAVDAYLDVAAEFLKHHGSRLIFQRLFERRLEIMKKVRKNFQDFLDKPREKPSRLNPGLLVNDRMGGELWLN